MYLSKYIQSCPRNDHVSSCTMSPSFTSRGLFHLGRCIGVMCPCSDVYYEIEYPLCALHTSSHVLQSDLVVDKFDGIFSLFECVSLFRILQFLIQFSFLSGEWDWGFPCCYMADAACCPACTSHADLFALSVHFLARWFLGILVVCFILSILTPYNLGESRNPSMWCSFISKRSQY